MMLALTSSTIIKVIVTSVSGGASIVNATINPLKRKVEATPRRRIRALLSIELVIFRPRIPADISGRETITLYSSGIGRMA